MVDGQGKWVITNMEFASRPARPEQLRKAEVEFTNAYMMVRC